MRIVHGREDSTPSEQRSTVTGEAWFDQILPATDGNTITTVFFAPGAHTYWHSHEKGQVLLVLAGRGLICSEGDRPRAIGAGDTVWVPAGERHWHGAAPDSFMTHIAISLGTTRWAEEVSEAEYSGESSSRESPATVPIGPIAFIGLGNMGGPMAARLVQAGYQVRGFDLAEPARQALIAAGGTGATDLADAVRGARVIVLMLPNSDAVAATVHDRQFEPADGAIVIDMGSSEPMRTRALAAELRTRGTTLIDAPVSGGVSRARTGELTIMTGGEPADLDRVTAILAHLGTATRAGSVGSGHAVKALNNLLSATHLLGTSEAILVGERFGLDPATMLSIFNRSSGRSGSTENKWPNFILPGTYDSGFALRLMLKDMLIATGLADQVDAPDPLGQAATQLWAQAAETFEATADHTEIVNWLRRDRTR